MVDHVEPGAVDYIDDLDPLIPQESGTQVAYANDNLRNIKKAVQQSFPNVAGVVAADHTELGYCDGVTSAIQTQLDGKAGTDGVLDDITVDTDLIVGDTAGNHVGINQASPAYDLHIGDDGGANTSELYIEGGATGFARLYLGDQAGITTRVSVDNASGTGSLLNASNQNVMFWASDRVVFNESQNDIDFRVESDTDANAIYLDAGNNRIGIFQGTPTVDFHVGDDATSNTSTFRIEGGSGGASVLQMGSGTVEFTIQCTNTSEELSILKGAVDRMKITGTEVVFNDDSATPDFRVESNGETHMLYVDGTNDKVGVGQSSPTGELHVGDDAGTNTTSIRVESGATSGLSRVIFGDATESRSDIRHDNSDNSFTITQNNTARCTFYSTVVVFNDVSNNYDFRIESNANANMFFVDANNDAVGIGTGSPNGTAALDVNGPIYQRGSETHPDFVFSPDYEAPDIGAHSAMMWAQGKLPKMPKSVIGDDGKAVLDVTQHMMGILEELELAHRYIAELEQRLKKVESNK